jgi:Tfp pilus assembly major pilin PilA
MKSVRRASIIAQANQRSAGFTIWELVICIGIIGFFATMALPMYRNFMVRSKITELRSLAHGATLSIDEFIQHHSRMPTSEGEVDFLVSGVPKYLKNITWEEQVLTLTGNPETMGLRPGEELSLKYRATVRNGGIFWECETVGPAKYAPSGCPRL